MSNGRTHHKRLINNTLTPSMSTFSQKFPAVVVCLKHDFYDMHMAKFWKDSGRHAREIFLIIIGAHG